MEFFEVIQSRRSIRRFTSEIVPDEVIEKALEAGILAPNSSNLQTWEFYWIKSSDLKEAMIPLCLGQGAAKTAAHLIVAVANQGNWKRNNELLLAEFRRKKSPRIVFEYYEKLIPFEFGTTWAWPFKWLFVWVKGLFTPTMRGPFSARDGDEVALKSSALACENIMLALTAQGYGSCPMEGFDETRVKALLGLHSRARVTMILGIGRPDPKGRQDERFRFDKSVTIKKI